METLLQNLIASDVLSASYILIGILLIDHGSSWIFMADWRHLQRQKSEYAGTHNHRLRCYEMGEPGAM